MPVRPVRRQDFCGVDAGRMWTAAPGSVAPAGLLKIPKMNSLPRRTQVITSAIGLAVGVGIVGWVLFAKPGRLY